MTASAHTNRIIVDGLEVGSTTLGLDVDEFRNPYAVATITTPLPDAATLERFDPRRSPRVHVLMRQTFGTSRPLSAISADYAGQTLRDLAVGSDPMNINTGFEDGLTGWSGSDPHTAGESVLTISTEHVHTGSSSLEAAGGPADPTWAFFLTDPPIPVRPGIPFVVEGYSYFVSDDAGIESTIDVTIDFLDANGAVVENVALADRGPQDTWWRTFGLISTPDNPAITSARMFVVGIAFPDFGERVWFDDVILRYARGSLVSLSSEYGEPFNAGGFHASSSVRAALWLRNRDADYAPGTLMLEATSPDALLLDYALVSDVAMSPPGNSVRDCCNMVLSHVLGAAVQDGTTGAETVETEALPWEPGEGAWDYLQSIVGQAGLRLWADELGLWHLENPSTHTVPGQLNVSPGNLRGLKDGISRDQGQWADAVVVTYEWDDARGDRQIRYDIAGPSNATRVIPITIERPYPGAGLAAARLRRAQAMGRILGLEAVADYGPRPFEAVEATVPGIGLQVGLISGVAWSQPSDTMTVRTRGVMTVGPNAWLATPSGTAWVDDSLTGVSWDEYTRAPTDEGV